MEAPILAALAAIVGDDVLLTGEATQAFSVDGTAPAAVVTPADGAAVAAVLAQAAVSGAGVIPWGAGTGMRLGNLPRRYDVALSLAGLDRLVEYEPADLTVTVEAGMPLARLQAALAERGQFLPLDPPGAHRATIGGILSRNATGPRRTAYGAPRDLLLGCRAALPDGTVVHAGGRVVKNVAGYDLCRLFTGALGTLGVFVEATFKVLPLPAATATLVASLPDLDGAIASGDAIRRARIPHLALEALNQPAVTRLAAAGCPALPETGAALLIEVGGGAAVVERLVRDLATALDGHPVATLRDGEAQARLWAAVRDMALPEGEPRPALALRASVLPAQVAETARFLTTFAWGLHPVMHARPAGGLVEAYGDAAGDPATVAAAVEGAMQQLAQQGGSLVVTEAAPDVKALLDVWGPSPSGFALMQRMKAQFDPAGVLNPGRFVGRL